MAPSSGAQVQKPPRRAACAAYRFCDGGARELQPATMIMSHFTHQRVTIPYYCDFHWRSSHLFTRKMRAQKAKGPILPVTRYANSQPRCQVYQRRGSQWLCVDSVVNALRQEHPTQEMQLEPQATINFLGCLSQVMSLVNELYNHKYILDCWSIRDTNLKNIIKNANNAGRKESYKISQSKSHLQRNYKRS